MIQERTYSSAIFFGKLVFSKHLEKEHMVFRAVRQCTETVIPLCITASGKILSSGNISLKLFMVPL